MAEHEGVDDTAGRRHDGDELARRIAAEYREMPGLRLTDEQAARLWGLERARCSMLLGILIDQGHLRRSADGHHVMAA